MNNFLYLKNYNMEMTLDCHVKVKKIGKLSVCVIKHLVMKTDVGVTVQFHAFFNVSTRWR
jgi:hypothetical protein